MPPQVLEWIVIVYAIINLFSAPYIFRWYVADTPMRDITVAQILVISFNAPVYVLLCFITFVIAATITTKELSIKIYSTFSRILSCKPFARKG